MDSIPGIYFIISAYICDEGGAAMKHNFQNNSIWFNVVLGIVCSILISIASVFAAAVCINNEYMNVSALDYVIPMTQAIAVLAAAFIVSKREKERAWLSSLLSAVGYLLLLIAAGVSIFGGVGGHVWVSVVTIIPAYFVGLLLCNRNKMKKKSTKHKKAFR